MSKFDKNIQFIVGNPKFVCDKLSKMSKVLSAHIIGIKNVESKIESADLEKVKQYVHSSLLTVANLCENLYIVNMIVMLLLNGESFSNESLSASEKLINTVSKNTGNEKNKENTKEMTEEEIERIMKEPERVTPGLSEYQQIDTPSEKIVFI